MVLWWGVILAIERTMHEAVAAIGSKKIARTEGVSFFRFQFHRRGRAGVSYAIFGFPAGSGNFFLFSREVAASDRKSKVGLPSPDSLRNQLFTIDRVSFSHEVHQDDNDRCGNDNG
jgi:hypothetical protein